MKIAYLADQKISNRDSAIPEIHVGQKGQPDFYTSSIVPSTLIHLKEEFEIILERIAGNIELK